MTTEQKILQIYQATRIAKLSAEEHDALARLTNEILQELKPKEEINTEDQTKEDSEPKCGVCDEVCKGHISWSKPTKK